MRHVKVSIEIDNGDSRDILIALLSEMSFDGFEEEPSRLLTYIAEESYNESELKTLTEPFGLKFEIEIIEPQNWNEVWEAGIQPVVVDGFCTIRAHFHDIAVTTPYCVVITPKMSFGTGHHATTQLMMMGMKDIDFVGMSVLDFGTGTGVLAILAGMLGATEVMAIDNDDWAVDNALENLARNNGKGIQIERATLGNLAERKYDIILANINRHILLQYMSGLYKRLNTTGVLLMSGLLVADEEIITDAATAEGFEVEMVRERNGWISVLCIRH
ncbi:MAG: 50S ribosomal protein L11 methyltransferase [Taibaiella sp.]|nr:50S ribosomal protein L11 methyltransferase [Taibaiella sp.]